MVEFLYVHLNFAQTRAFVFVFIAVECLRYFVRTESVRTIAPFWGGKRCGVDVPLYAANCGKLDSSIFRGNIECNSNCGERGPTSITARKHLLGKVLAHFQPAAWQARMKKNSKIQ